jgi:hypothetical protein
MKVIQDKEVVFVINPNINPTTNEKLANSILGGMYFRKDKSGNLQLVFGQKYLDTYTKNSTIHYTILMHEFRHIYDYYQNKTTYFGSNEKDRFFYELNAVNIEAEFIKYYLLEKLNISKCENYILRSYEHDNLDSWTITNRKESADIYRLLNDMETEYKQNIISKKQFVEKLLQKADQLLAKSDQFLNRNDVYNAKEDIFSRHGHFMRLKTFEKYLRQIFKYDLAITELLSRNSDFNDKFAKITKLLEQHDEANMIYSAGLDNYYQNNCLPST